jgi:DnaJ-domain-containing protein 1
VDTSDLLPTLAAGDLSQTSGAELVAAIFRSRASGTLSLEGAAGADIRVFFRAGDMCGCALFSGFRTLAQVLLEQDWVGALEIDATWAESEAKGRRHGEVLVEKGLLTPDQLNLALGMQHRQNLAALLALTSGRYEWRGWEPPPPWTKEIHADPVGVIVDAFRSERLLARRAAILSWLGELPARLSVDWQGLSSRIILSPEDRKATALLARPRTLPQFIAASGLPREHAEALLVTLMLAGCAEPQEGSAPPPQEEELPELDVLDEPEPEPEPARSPPRRMAEAEALERLEQLELDPEPGTAETEDEPLELATGKGRRDQSPGRGAARDSDPGLATEKVSTTRSAAEGMEERVVESRAESSDDESAAARRRRMRARGMRNLGQGVPESPREDRPVEIEVDPPAAGADQDPGPEDQRFIDEVRSRLRLAARQTAYEVLSVEPTSSTDKIRAAYLDLVKRFHPDRAAVPCLSSVVDDLRGLFDAIKEAYELVSSTSARQQYDDQLKHPKGPEKGNAKTLVKMGEVLLKKRDFPGAIQKLRQAVEADANGDTLAALAWGLLNDPAASNLHKEESAVLIQKALRSPGLTARTYYVAGVVWRTKDPESSIEAFKKALELDPHHPDAALELRLLEMRQSKSGKKAGGGVLAGLLFGKRKG